MKKVLNPCYDSLKKKKKHLGLFIDEYEAHLAYQKALEVITASSED